MLTGELKCHCGKHSISRYQEQKFVEPPRGRPNGLDLHAQCQEIVICLLGKSALSTASWNAMLTSHTTDATENASEFVGEQETEDADRQDTGWKRTLDKS